MAYRQSGGQDTKDKEGLSTGLILHVISHWIGQKQLPLEVHLVTFWVINQYESKGHE